MLLAPGCMGLYFGLLMRLGRLRASADWAPMVGPTHAVSASTLLHHAHALASSHGRAARQLSDGAGQARKPGESRLGCRRRKGTEQFVSEGAASECKEAAGGCPLPQYAGCNQNQDAELTSLPAYSLRLPSFPRPRR